MRVPAQTIHAPLVTSDDLAVVVPLHVAVLRHVLQVPYRHAAVAQRSGHPPSRVTPRYVVHAIDIIIRRFRGVGGGGGGGGRIPIFFACFFFISSAGIAQLTAIIPRDGQRKVVDNTVNTIILVPSIIFLKTAVLPFYIVHKQ